MQIFIDFLIIILIYQFDNFKKCLPIFKINLCKFSFIFE